MTDQTFPIYRTHTRLDHGFEVVTLNDPEGKLLDGIYAILKPNGWLGMGRYVTAADAVVEAEKLIAELAPKPLDELTLTLRQLRDGRNELKTVSLTEVGHIVHGLRCAIQKGHDKDGELAALVHRLTRTTALSE